MYQLSKRLFSEALHTTVRPFNGFWDLKYERDHNKSLAVSFIILALVIVTNILQSQYSGFLVTFGNPNHFNSLLEATYVIVPVLFFCVANWSLTTLMDGEGKFKEIFMATCYALIPLVVINFPLIIVSNFISLQEAAFYYFFGSFSFLWMLFLLFVGNMTVHQYTPAKTIATMLFTVVAMGFIAFLCLLFFNLVQQIVSFVSTIYREITLRS